MSMSENRRKKSESSQTDEMIRVRGIISIELGLGEAQGL